MATRDLIQNNQIHHNWRAFYSSGVGGLKFTKNVVHDNYEYGIDPHSGTHDMYITFNKSYNNNHGIICSQDCYNIHIENNELYKNRADGIFLNADSHHSFIKNNNIHDQDTAIQLPSISYSEISGNTITNSKYGIKLYTESGSKTINNNIHHNNIKASNIGIQVRDGASTNSLTSNTIDGLGTGRGIVVKGSTTSSNVISDNYFSNAKYPISLSGGNINSKFINNHFSTVAPSGEYTLESASALKIETTQFSSDVIKSQDSSNSPVSISKSGVISVIDGVTGVTKKYDTNAQAFSKTLKNAKITITSSPTSSVASLTSPSLKSSGGVDSSQDDVTPTISSNFNEDSPTIKANNTDESNAFIRNNSGKDLPNPSDIDLGGQHRMIQKISPQQNQDEAQAKLAQQQAQNNLIKHNSAENKLSQTQQPSHDQKEKDKTIESTTPDESTNDVTRKGLGRYWV